MNHALVLVALKSEITLSCSAVSGSGFFSLWKPVAKLYEQYFLCHHGTKHYGWLVAKYSKRKNIICRGILCAQDYIYPKRILVRPLKFLHYAYARSHILDFMFSGVCDHCGVLHSGLVW